MKYINNIVIIIILFCVLFLPGCRKPEKAYEATDIIMGTVISQKVFGENNQAAAEEVTARIRNLEKTLSFYQKESEISRLNTSAGKDKVTLSPETFFLLSKSIEYSNLSDGAFNIMVGPLVKKWKVTGENPVIPSSSEIKSLLLLIDYRDLKLNRNDNSAKLSKNGQMVDLGGIAKGFAGDEALKIYKKHGIKSALLDIGGNISLLGIKPDGSPWTIGVQDPKKKRGEYVCSLSLQDRSFSTSGGYERYFEKDGKIYHHIIDPKTGYPSQSDLLSATIIGETSVDTDALSTSVFILGLEKGIKLLTKTSFEAVLITTDSKIHATAGLKNMIECERSVIFH
jgi:FAD:protein FMN transferase